MQAEALPRFEQGFILRKQKHARTIRFPKTGAEESRSPQTTPLIFSSLPLSLFSGKGRKTVGLRERVRQDTLTLRKQPLRRKPERSASCCPSLPTEGKAHSRPRRSAFPYSSESEEDLSALSERPPCQMRGVGGNHSPRETLSSGGRGSAPVPLRNACAGCMPFRFSLPSAFCV